MSNLFHFTSDECIFAQWLLTDSTTNNFWQLCKFIHYWDMNLASNLKPITWKRGRGWEEISTLLEAFLIKCRLKTEIKEEEEEDWVQISISALFYECLFIWNTFLEIWAPQFDVQIKWSLTCYKNNCILQFNSKWCCCRDSWG